MTLALHGVGVRYGSTVAVSGVEVTVAEGSCLAIIGPSGAGKSSLLLALNRLHDLDPEVWVDGEVRLGDADIRSVDARELRRRVGLVFQQPTPFPLSIRENVLFPLRAHGFERSGLEDRLERCLRQAALWEEVSRRLDTPAFALSGGQQQRLCLARALALEPDVLLLDEPCASLDPAATMEVERALADLEGVTRIVVTHNLGQARRLADRCLALWPGPDGGQVADLGPVQRVLDAPEHSQLAAWLAGALG